MAKFYVMRGDLEIDGYLSERDCGETYFVENGKYVLPMHNYIEGMSIFKVYKNNIAVAFFKLMETISGIKSISQLSKELGVDVPWKLELPPLEETNPDFLEEFARTNVFQEMKSKKVEQYLYGVGRQMIVQQDALSRWTLFWTTMEFLHQECDVVSMMCYYGAMHEVLRYLFRLESAREIQLFMCCRVVEKLNDYLYECEKWNTKTHGLRKCITMRKKVHPDLQTLYRFRTNDLDLRPVTRETGVLCNQFVLEGQFECFRDVVPPSVLPYSDFPDDGLLFRLFLSLYVISYCQTLSEDVRKNLKRELCVIFKELMEEYANLKEVVGNLKMPQGGFVPVSIMRSVYDTVNNSLARFYRIIYRDSVLQACGQLKLFIDKKIQTHRTQGTDTFDDDDDEDFSMMKAMTTASSTHTAAGTADSSSKMEM